jgi:hypothetical protein
MSSNASPTSESQDASLTKTKQTGYQVWHFLLAVPAIAITLQIMLGSLTPLPAEHDYYTMRYAAALQEPSFDPYPKNTMPEIEILPLHLRGEMTGPVLAQVIQDYIPESTTQHATDFRDALPPCDDPRMIVILPKDDEQVF